MEKEGFLEWTRLDFSSKLSLTHGGNVTIIKCSSSYSYSACGNREHPGNFQNKSVSSLFNWVSRYIFFLVKLKTTERPFFERPRRGCDWGWGYIVRLPPRALGSHKRRKSPFFVKFETILLLLCCSLDPFTNKQFRAWNFMINLWIDSRTCQKYKILLSARQRSNNYLELSKESIFGNVMLSH